MLDAIWSAAEHLPAEKQNRLKAPFLETVAKSGDTLLLRHWQARLGADLRREKAVEPYARKKAKAALSRGNWTAFLRDARAGAQPFNIGRPEIMAEGARLAPDAPTRRRVVDAMFELAGRPIAASGLDRSFEQADFGHSLAELAMEACDLSSFDRAIALTADPSLYAMRCGGGGLPGRPERWLGASGRTRIPTIRTMFVLPSTAMDPSSSSVIAIDGNLNRVRALHADGVYAH